MECDRCLKCKNYLSDLKCLAFNNIPDEILLDENDHSEPLPNQENDIVFEPINENDNKDLPN